MGSGGASKSMDESLYDFILKQGLGLDCFLHLFQVTVYSSHYRKNGAALGFPDPASMISAKK